MALAATLTDDFNDNSLDTTKWATNLGAGATATETGGQMVLSTPGTVNIYAAIYSQVRYDLTESAVQVECVSDLPLTTGHIAALELQLDGSNAYKMLTDGTGLQAQTNIGGTITSRSSITYTPSVRFWRIRHTAGTVYFEYSPTGQAGTWVLAHSRAPDFAITALQIQLSGGNYIAVTAGTVVFDNVNLEPPTPVFVGAGTAAWTASNGATFTPTLPTGWVPGDLHVLVAQRNDNTAMTALSGWTQVAALSGNNGTGQRVEVWTRTAQVGDTNPAVTFGSSTLVRGGRIYGVRNTAGLDTGTGVPTRSSNATLDLTVEFTGLTTTKAALCLAIGAFNDDAAAGTAMSGWVNPPDSFVNTTLGNDASQFYQYRNLNAAGAASPATVTVSGGTAANAVSVGLVLAFAPSVPLAVQRWTGSAFTPATVQRWSGSAWVPATVKRWNGTSWV